jgi:hypothetical protein
VGLSLPFDGPRPRAAACRLLETGRPERWLDRLHPLLMWHRCWGHALAHIARAGGDLDRLSLCVETILGSFPVRGRRLWSLEAGVAGRRLTLASWEALLGRHKRLLREATAEVVDGGSAEIVLLSGRAIEVLYPDYHERLALDSDLGVATAEAGMALVAELAGRGYAVRFLRALDRGGDSALVVEAGLERFERGHSVTLEIEMGEIEMGEIETGELGRRGNERGSRGGRFLPTDWNGRRVLVPSPEELLVRLCRRLRTQRSLQQVSVNDAAVILGRDANALDWAATALRLRAEGLLVHFRLLVDAAEAATGAALVPAARRSLLELAGFDRRLLGWAGTLDLAWPDDPGSMSTAGLRGRLLGRLTRSGVAAARGPGPLRATFERLAHRVQLRAARSLPRRWAPFLRWMSALRPHLGSLCELRGSPLDPAAGFCLSGLLGRRPEGPCVRIGELASALPGPGSRPHDCYRLEYRLEEPPR